MPNTNRRGYIMETGIIVGQIYKSLWEAIKDLTPTDKSEIYDAIFFYQFVGEMPKFKNKLLEALFKSHLPTLDKFINSRQNQIKASRENGKKGGRPKTETKPIKTQENPQVIIENLNKTKETQQNLIKNKEIKNNNINNNIIKKENNIKEKSLAVVKTTAQTEQAEVFEYFASLYKQATNIEYLGKQVDYINLAKLIKKYGKELVIRKIKWLLIGCKNSVFWFSKDINDFTVSTLTTHWDRILPKLTEEQKREQEKKKKEEEDRQRVKAELAKQGIVFDDEGGMNNVRLQ